MLKLMLSVLYIFWFKEFTNKILCLMGEELTFQPNYVAEWKFLLLWIQDVPASSLDP
jgi:hypothetical protein